MSACMTLEFSPNEEYKKYFSLFLLLLFGFNIPIYHLFCPTWAHSTYSWFHYVFTWRAQLLAYTEGMNLHLAARRLSFRSTHTYTWLLWWTLNTKTFWNHVGYITYYKWKGRSEFKFRSSLLWNYVLVKETNFMPHPYLWIKQERRMYSLALEGDDFKRRTSLNSKPVRHCVSSSASLNQIATGSAAVTAVTCMRISG